MTTAATTPVALFNLIMGNLIKSLGVRCSPHPHHWPAGWGGGVLKMAFAKILHRRLGRAMIRFRVLFALAEARAAANSGVPVPAQPSRRRARKPHHAEPERKPGNPPERLPWRFGWLLPIARETGVFGAHVHYLVTQPEIQPLIESDPRFGRILRPIFHALGVAPPAYLQLPERSRIRKQRPPQPRQPRVKRWSVDYETQKEGRTGAPEALPPWYLPRPSPAPAMPSPGTPERGGSPLRGIPVKERR